MSVRLVSFQFLKRGLAGWESGLLHFGDMFTAVQGENGTGKTPILKGVVHGLGHEVELPPDILAQCAFSQVNLNVNGRPIALTRRISEDFELSVVDGESNIRFTAQKEYARWFAALLGVESPTLTNKQKQPAELYVNVLFPAFWVDQDRGWTTDYWIPANRNFILDQREEVIRFLVGLPPRHPYRSIAKYENAKERLSQTVSALEMQRFIVERLKWNERLSEDEEPQLIQRQTELRQELEKNSELLEAIRSATAYFDKEITILEAKRNRLESQSGVLTRRKGQLSLVLSELEGEEDILTANVHATDLLRQFCGREECQLFATSERSFGRSLLFLKDQIKDLKASNRTLSRESESIDRQVSNLDDEIAAKRQERETVVGLSPQAELLGKLGAMTKAIVEVELRLARLRQLTGEQQKFERLLDEREQAEADVAEARRTGVKGARSTDDVRLLLGEAMQGWLQTLGTQNTIMTNFDEDFDMLVDGSKFTIATHQSGSTRTRIILAFHASLLEVSLARGGNHPGWLLFDAPKQHELKQSDFDAYTDRLESLAVKYPGRIQVVFSVADLKTQFQAGDEVWLPRYKVDGKSRFLGID